MSKQRIFRLQGTAVTPEGHAIRNLRLAIVDEDTMSDDLLGVGFTDPKGQFRISFTSREFNQDLFESEQLPDIYIVFSRANPEDGQFKAIFRQSFPTLKFEDDREDLGKIKIATWQDPPKFLADVDATPGYRKKVQRLDLDDDLARHCLEEITPFVECLTGWSGLLEDLNVDVTDDIGSYINRYILEAFGAQEQDLFSKALNKITMSFVNLIALYDPIRHSVAINRKEAAAQNLDALKVILGHELVHVGQFKYHPHLREEQKQHMQKLRELVEQHASLSPQELAQAIQASSPQKQMSKLEGYAYYIQRDFLEKHYNMATYFQHTSVLDMVSKHLLPHLIPGLDSLAGIKSSQYVDGMESFRSQGTGRQPARFSDAL